MSRQHLAARVSMTRLSPLLSVKSVGLGGGGGVGGSPRGHTYRNINTHVLVHTHTQRNACGQPVREPKYKNRFCEKKRAKLDCFCCERLVKPVHLRRTSAFLEEPDPSGLPGAWLQPSMHVCDDAACLSAAEKLFKNNLSFTLCFVRLFSQPPSSFQVSAAIGCLHNPPTPTHPSISLSQIGSAAPSERANWWSPRPLEDRCVLQLLWRHWRKVCNIGRGG